MSSGTRFTQLYWNVNITSRLDCLNPCGDIHHHATEFTATSRLGISAWLCISLGAGTQTVVYLSPDLATKKLLQFFEANDITFVRFTTLPLSCPAPALPCPIQTLAMTRPPARTHAHAHARTHHNTISWPRNLTTRHRWRVVCSVPWLRPSCDADASRPQVVESTQADQR